MNETMDGLGQAANPSRVPAREAAVWKTPMFEQYWKIREGLGPKTFLFYRMGDFYELFGEDAVQAAPLLEVQLTARNKEAPVPVPMCGVPVFAIDSYAERILGAGFKVALCEQLSDPAAAKSKHVERGIVRVLTPGLPIDHSRLEAKEPHYFVALGFAEQSFQVAALDLLASTLHFGDVDTEEALEELLGRLSPKEILIPAQSFTRLQKSDGHELRFLRDKHFERLTPWPGTSAAENLKEYLEYTQRLKPEEVAKLLPEKKPLRLLSGAADSEYARVPAAVLEQWAVLPELHELLDGSATALGSRRLRHWLSTPLRKVVRIQARQKALALWDGRAESFLRSAREVYDLERLLGRFRLGAAAPKELLRFHGSLRAVLESLKLAPLPDDPAWQNFVSEERLKPLAPALTEAQNLHARLDRSLNREVDASRSDSLGDLIQSGFDPDFDRLRSLQAGAEQWLLDFESALKSESSIPTLKIRFNRVFGYFIEVTKTHLAKVPAHFERKQTTVNGERFTTATLREKEQEILSAGQKAEARAREILDELQANILSVERSLRTLLEHFSWMDAMAGVERNFLRLRRFGAWVVPECEAKDFFLELVEARHPVLEERLQGNFVPNSLELGVGDKRLLLLTGPNMAGKSTLMRQSGLCLLLAQCGLRVPATRMRFSPCSGFFSRMGASDRILEGESTFMVEMKESARILHEADRESFVLIDEIGRGTSTEDGLAIARAVLEHLAEKTQGLGIFATHYHELSEFSQALPSVFNGSMGIKEWEGDLIFLRQLVLEPASSSYGIFVAKMAGLPSTLIARAEEHFKAHERETTRLVEESTPSRSSRKKTRPENQLDFFQAPPDPRWVEMENRLKTLALDELSPRAAWDLLHELRQVVLKEPS